MNTVPKELLRRLAADAPLELATTSGASSTPSSDNGRNGTYKSRLKVAEWLNARGISFKTKATADDRGRTVYVLDECPFNPDHRAPDACVMQDPIGKMFAKCFHNSCQGLGWQDFKAKIGPPGRDHYDPPLVHGRERKKEDASEAITKTTETQEEGIGGEQKDDLHQIQGNERQLRDVTADALQAILERNDPPTVFQRGGVLTRCRTRDDNGEPYLETLDGSALRGVLARVADWFAMKGTGDKARLVEDAPPQEVVNDLLSLPAWAGIPRIQSVVESPFLDQSGRLITTPGFHPKARVWYHPDPRLVLPAVPEQPSREDIDKAKALLLVELYGDFPFEDDASKAHILSALLLPFVRLLIDGPTPLHLLDAPTEGTGKTLLAQVTTMVPCGRPADGMPECGSDEEWRKRLTSTLREAVPYIFLDNINRLLDSGPLASAITLRTWKDRILGHSLNTTQPVSCVWLASGNNCRLSREMIRRAIWTRLDAKLGAPWERTDFRHKNLYAWVKTNRGALVWAALTLCQAWVAAGKPAGQQTLGMFESWAAVIGGILDVAGIPGLLANAKKFRAAAIDVVSEWRAFVEIWWGKFQDRPVGVAELFTLATEQKLLDSVLGDKGERSQRVRHGIAIGKMVDRVLGAYRLVRAQEDHKGCQQYQLQHAQTKPVGESEVAAWSA